MKNAFLLVFLLFLSNLSFFPKLDFKLIEKLTKISFVSIDEYMVGRYGFLKLEKKSEGRKSTYARDCDNDFNNSIIIIVVNRKDTPNVLDISLGNNYNIPEVKDEIITLGYENDGSNEFDFVI